MAASPATAPPAPPAGPRLLCLHGYCQNGAVLRAKTHALRKALQRSCGAQLVFADAPHLAPELPAADVAVGSGIRAEKRAWWIASAPDGTPREAGGKVYGGWAETLEYVVRVFAEQGPFDGILAFSQGAVLAHIISALSRLPPTVTPSSPDLPPPYNPLSAALSPLATLRFAILVSGFPSRALIHEPLLALPPLALPSLHVWGVEDALVPPAASRALARLFDAGARVELEHAGGHCVPQKKAEREAIAAFVARFATGGEGSDGAL